jgi:hypothetical protein
LIEPAIEIVEQKLGSELPDLSSSMSRLAMHVALNAMECADAIESFRGNWRGRRFCMS